MNKLRLPGTIWLASDIHLGPATPATWGKFQWFLEQAGANADALLLCGDIFDAWIGDDVALDATPPWLAQVFSALKETASKIPVWIGRGNRDFLMGQALAKFLGAHLLGDIVRLETDQEAIIVSHGDEYCTDDTSYQRFKRLVRHPLTQGVFLSLGVATRRKIADYARRRSMSSHAAKAAYVMDVNAQAVQQAFARHGVATLIHGHTHRPAIHRTDGDTGLQRRVVLPDWDFDHPPHRGGWAIIDAQGVRLEYLS